MRVSLNPPRLFSALVLSSSAVIASFVAVSCVVACSSSPTPISETSGEDGGSSTLDAAITPGAPGGACSVADTCQSKICTNLKCTTSTPKDGVKNGKESDVDCGGGEGTTPACVTGKKCGGDSDCTLHTCIKGICENPTNSDGRKNNTETDVDCGGPDVQTARCKPAKKCAAATDCTSNVCIGKICMVGTANDQTRNDDETDVDCGGSRAPVCVAGQGCASATDCTSGICTSATKTCAGVHPNDGVKNGTETDVDCGGPDAPVCAAGLTCAAATDCDSGFCTATKCEPRKAGRKDGDETDIDCGGKIAPKCVADNTCLADADCLSSACSSKTKKCLEGPTCRNVLGGETCGQGEVGAANANHESCCRTLKVPGFTDSKQPGKTVYLDKYEITAGRMRAFVDAITAANAGQPNLKGYITANRPSRWVTGWEKALPAGYTAGDESYTVTNPTVDMLYPGQDIYLTNRTQSTWSVISGNYTINAGLFYSFTSGTLFPEYYTTPNVGWPSADYAVTHGYNCGNGATSFGTGTYYFDNETIKTYGGGIGKYFSQNELDVKAMNCAPFAAFAAMCAWDGGQLATEEVFNFVSSNGSRVLVNGQTPDCSNGINSAPDGSYECGGFKGRALVYYYPAANNVDYTGASRVAPPGRIAADVVRINANDEPWYDLKGNLLETVIRSNNTFNYAGWGIGWSTVQHHRNQILTPRMKGGSFGARCMRFK